MQIAHAVRRFSNAVVSARMNTEDQAMQRAFSLKISESLWRLMTESVRLFSNKRLRFASISDVVNDRAPEAATMHAHYRPSSFTEHLRIIPTDGEIGVELEILESSVSAIDGSVPGLEQMIGSSVSFASAVSLVLFDFIVEEARTEAMSKLGLNAEDAAAFRAAAHRVETNVIPFR